MHKPTCYKAIVLLLGSNLIWVKKKFLKHFRLVKGIPTDNNGDSDDPISDRHSILGIKIPAR